jgi:high-affinity Fe2+/Pb2+ permease
LRAERQISGVCVKPVSVTIDGQVAFLLGDQPTKEGSSVSILWIILIIVLVLLLLGFFSRGRW